MLFLVSVNGSDSSNQGSDTVPRRGGTLPGAGSMQAKGEAEHQSLPKRELPLLPGCPSLLGQTYRTCASNFLCFVLRSTLATSAACPILVLSLKTIWSNQTCIAAGGVPDPQLNELSRVFVSKKASGFF